MAEIVYLMGSDSGSTNQFYTNASSYFAAQTPAPTIVTAPSAGQTLEGVFADLKTRGAKNPAEVFDVINLVSHASGFGSMEFGLRKTPNTGYVIQDDLNNALAAAKTPTPWFAPPGKVAVTNKTHVRIYGCDVGRDTTFITSLGTLFGTPGDDTTLPADIAAPLRVAVFRHVGTNFMYRLAKTWSMKWPNNIAQTLPVSDAVATQFVDSASSSFGTERMARTFDIASESIVKNDMNAAVASAKAGTGDFWLHEVFEVVFPAGTTSASAKQTWVDSVPKQSSKVLAPTGDVDDTNVKLTVGPPDFTDKTSATKWVAHIAILGHLIDTAVNLADSAQYNTVVLAPKKAPTTPPP